MEQIDVHDLPEPVAQALATIAQAVRQELEGHAADKPSGEGGKIKAWPLGVKEPLTREAIYEERLDQNF